MLAPRWTGSVSAPRWREAVLPRLRASTTSVAVGNEVFTRPGAGAARYGRVRARVHSVAVLTTSFLPAARTARSTRRSRVRLAKAQSSPSNQRLPRPEHGGLKRRRRSPCPQPTSPRGCDLGLRPPLGHGTGGIQLPHGLACLTSDKVVARSGPQETNPTADRY